METRAREERHPKKSFRIMMLCLCRLGIHIPKDIRQMLFDYVVVKNPLFNKWKLDPTITDPTIVLRSMLTYKREITIPAFTMRCDDIFATKGASTQIKLILSLANPTTAKFIERTENALSEKVKIKNKVLTETLGFWSLVYEYPVTDCAYHPEGHLDSVNLLRHGWCGHHDICLTTFPGVLKRNCLVDFPIVLTVDGLTISNGEAKMLFRMEEKTC